MAGTLYVIATPIGNLLDLAPRAAELLADVDLLLCEDTRHTARLLAHIGATTRTRSLNAHNEAERAKGVVERLLSGERIGLVSDAGTPCLCDPGARLVDAAHAAGVTVVSVPGPFAAAAALAGAGIGAVPFTFWGFVDKRGQARQTRLRACLRAGPGGAVHAHTFFVPGRDLRAFCGDVAIAAPSSRVVVARELSKVHEGFVRGTAGRVADLLKDEQLRGEAVVVIEVDQTTEAGDMQVASLGDLIGAAVAAGEARKTALRRIALQTGASRRELYALWVDATADR